MRIPVFGIVFLFSGIAVAQPTKEVCIASNANAQALTLDGHFVQAHAALVQCAAASCPRIVRTDCAHQLTALEERQPSLLIAVHDADGRDRVDATVTLDGQPWLTKLDGLAVDVDPGPHVLAIVAPDRAPVTESIVVREGEKKRPVTVTFTAPAPAPRVLPPPVRPPTNVTIRPQDAPAPPAAQRGAGRSAARTAGLVLAGVGVAGLAVGGVFGGLAFADWSSAKDACSGSPGHCTGNVTAAEGHRSDAETAATASTIALGVGGAAVVAGAAVFFTARRHPSDAPPGVTVTPGVSIRGGGLLVSGAF